MSEETPTLTLHDDDLSWLDLMLLGAIEPRYTAPGSDRDPAAFQPSLVVPSDLGEAAATAGTLDLLDPEGVTLARVAIKSITEVEGDGGPPGRVSIAGAVSAVSGFSHLDNLDMRTPPANFRASLAVSAGPVVAVWTAVPSPFALRQAAAQLARAKAGSVLEVVPVPSGSETSHAANLAARLARLSTTRSKGDRAVVVPAPPVEWDAAGLLIRARVVAAFGAKTLAISPLVMETLMDQQAEVTKKAEAIGIELVALSVLNEHAAMTAEHLERLLATERPLPDWFAEPVVAQELRRLHRPTSQAGFTVLLSGLSGSGKSTVARALAIRLLETEFRSVSLLDGDAVRHHLSKGLGFARADRDTNVRRIGFVASEITKAGGIAIACPIAPYDATRRDVRAMIQEHGGFVLVHIATPLEECERRDRKGLYAKARRGEIPEFTGISDPYEVPTDAEVVVDTTGRTIESCVDDVIATLRAGGFITSQ